MRPDESFVGQPVRSLQTMLRVIAKDDPRLPRVIPDGIYGPSTMNAVAGFQRLFGLPITGTTDQETWDSIVAVYEESIVRVDKAAPIEILLEPGQVITKGQSSPYVYLMQGMLAYLSTTNPTIPEPGLSGILDEETAQSLAIFQNIAAIEETGNMDRLTWLYLVNHFTLTAHMNEGKAK